MKNFTTTTPDVQLVDIVEVGVFYRYRIWLFLDWKNMLMYEYDDFQIV